MPEKPKTPPQLPDDPKRFRDWAIETGWLLVDKAPPSCAICALPDFVRAELETAWNTLGARETELTSYLSVLGFQLPSTEPFAQHFRSTEHRSE